VCKKGVELKRMTVIGAPCFRTAKLKISVFAPTCAGLSLRWCFSVFLSDEKSPFYKLNNKIG